MSAHTFFHDKFMSELAGANEIVDPGDGGTFDLGDISDGICRVNAPGGAETRVLPSPDGFELGHSFTIMGDVLGSLTIYALGATYFDSSGADAIIMTSDGQWVTLFVGYVTGVKFWLVRDSDVQSIT